MAIMRVWLYYRLSRDEDKELNSLTNQKKILVDYANNNEFAIVGESFDDNISGMHFQRDGIAELQDAAEKRLFDAVLVKDLSRLGRHRAQTAMFIDYLRTCKIKVISVTENIDTFNENDDLIVGFKQILNDHYSKDISRKIRAGFKQKQKEGIVLIPPFGYIKSAYTKQVEIVPECAEIVRQVFRLYNSGLGMKKVAAMLTDQGIKSPGYYQKLHYNKSIPFNKTKVGHQYIWSPKSVEFIIRNEAYIGVLVCGKTSKSTIYKTRENTSPENQIRHENYFEPIIDMETWNLTRAIERNRIDNKVRASSNRKIHRYAGLLKCGDCGGTFVARKRALKTIGEYIEYVCVTNHKVGAKYCTPHTIREGELDELLNAEILRLRGLAYENMDAVEEFIQNFGQQKDSYESTVAKLKAQAVETKEKIKMLIMQTVEQPDRKPFIDEIIKENQSRMTLLEKQIEDLQEPGSLGRNAREVIKNSIDMIGEIIANNYIDDAHLNLIIEKIVITQAEEKQVNLEFILKAPFRTHIDANRVLKYNISSEQADLTHLGQAR